ncbi:MAG: hypothetical protein J6K28_00415 [Alistipes sp.]|nr:hypothetical protein [Alistipes sp.]
MRNILIFAIGCLLIGCTSHEETDATVCDGFITEFSATIETTRAAIDVATGKVTWEEGDAVAVSNGSTIAEFTYDETSGKFSISKGELATSNSYTAVYPASICKGIIDGGIAVELPEIQNYYDGIVRQAPMSAAATEPSFTFRNICGILKLQLGGEQEVSEIVFTAADGVSGTAVVADGALRTDDGSGKSLMLRCGKYRPLEADTPFYIVIPAQTYDNGFSLDVRFADGTVFTKSTSVARTVTANRIDAMKLFEARTASGFPYILSMMTVGIQNGDKGPDLLQYSIYNGDGATGHADDVSLTAKDDERLTLTAKMCGSGNYLGFRHWHDNSGHHNCPLKSWTTGDENYLLATIPLDETLWGTLRLSLGIGASSTAPANWKMLYSTDNTTWHTPAPADAPHFVVPKNKSVGGGKNFFYYSLVFRPEIPLEKGSTLYIRISPYDTTSVGGGSVADGGEMRLHSCFVLEHYHTFSTPRPANAVYFEPFDCLTEGLDYRYGDKLCAMLNYCGSDISSWSDDIRNGLAGIHVRQRSGYAQIGFVETQTIAQNAYTNNAGALTTPAFGATGTLNVTFDAMAYKNTSVFSLSNPNNNAKDIAGDITTVTVEVIGGGTIDGATKTTIGGLSYTEFKTFAFTIDGATESTALKFSSEPADGQFSRWFIDNICVTK